ncbi:unnamed protein product [Tuber aestivum]|uniref:Fungal N-terminal domain-containing protein n=1 Tax=Tuber aestivum TaxID=59557 RepID=A0A292PVZ0_9PEZI|nr:unnamed protein product [Tuber aestivum]
MSFGISMGDFIAGAKLAWDLYHKCFLVAKDAPNEFLELMRELSSLRGVLKCIEDEISTRRIDEPRQLAIKRTMDGTTHTLRRLESLVLKYRKLGFSDGLHFWKRIGWVREQRDIEGFRVRIMIYACTLNLCVSSVGESTISTIERDFKQALQQQSLSNLDSVLPLGFVENSRRESQASRFTDQSSLSQREGNESPTTSPPASEYLGPPASVRPTSPMGSVNSTATDLIDFSMDMDPDSSSASVLDVLARASDLLSNCSERGSVLRPPVTLDWDPPSLGNLVSDAAHKRFLTNAGRATGDRRIPVEDLLRTGTWWVLKSRNTARLQDNSIPNASTASSIDPNSGLYQAYFDLMKASWLLYNYLLSDPDNTVNMSDEDIKSFTTLQDAVDEDFENFRRIGLSSDDIEDMKLNDKIWEAKQPREVASDERERNPLLDPGSFVNAELGNKRVRMKTRDARYMLILWTKDGQSELKITLCNQSGTLRISRDITLEDIRPFRRVNEGSNVPPAVDIEFPEMETTIHFLHISGKLCTVGDGAPFTRKAMLGVRSRNSRQIFERQEVRHYFRTFVGIPTRFFDAVQERNPTSGNETEIYRRYHPYSFHQDLLLTFLIVSDLHHLELLHPNTNRPITPGKAFHSVDLRVYETAGEEGWMTTRRLVLSSSASAAQPWCKSYFLPLSGVRMRSDGPQKLTVRWSDCGHRVSASNGAFNEVVSYVYDEEKPNICLGLGFGSVDDANCFEEVVSKLSLREKYRWDSTQECRYIYSIRNTANGAERFKGLLIRHRGSEWRYSEAFYLPRDLDFELKNNGPRLRLLKAYYANYISDHVERLYDLEPGKQPKFSHCEKKVDSVNLCFGSIDDAQSLLRHITDRWELTFARQIARVSHKPTNQKSFFRVAGSSGFGPADLSLWKKGNVHRLVIRRCPPHSSSAELYLTALLHKDFDHDSEKLVVQKNVEIARGVLLDIATMEAVGGKKGGGAAGGGGGGWVKASQTLTIEFGTVRERELLAEALEPSLL